ncbi:mitochondrial inner membrane protein OXA1L-like [Convolutriloba macropyga]|uniref:mitochondrial inner membrane protein OXA1L-like n=1 Tax=Convolutriloba macropyga TaxID=536237 RepID=UPI003F5229B9
MSCIICSRISRMRPALSSSISHTRTANDPTINQVRSLVTNPSLVGQLSTSKFLTPTAQKLTETTGLNVDLPMQTMSELGFTYYWPSDLAARFLEFLHTQLGFSYIAAIVACGLTVRGAVWYSMVQQQKFLGTLMEKQTTKQEIQYEYDLAKSQYRHEHATKLFGELKYLELKNVQDLRAVVPHYAVQMIFFAGMTRALRNCNTMLPGFQTGGLPWSPNLALTDSTLMLPCISAATVFAYLSIMRKLTPVGQEMPGENQSALKIYSRLAAISLIPGLISYSGIVSSAFNIYLLTTFTVGLTQNFIIRMPSLKGIVALPPSYPRRMPHYLELSMDSSVGPLPKDNNNKPLSRWGAVKQVFRTYKESAKREGTRKQKQQSRHEIQKRYHQRWENAGKGPVPVTYDVNPLRPVSDVDARI